jgi:hypothetical protein
MNVRKWDESFLVTQQLASVGRIGGAANTFTLALDQESGFPTFMSCYNHLLALQT